MNRHALAPLIVSKRSVVSHAVGNLLRQIRNILTVLEHRCRIRHISELDDWILKDIGLSRAEVDGALAEPLTCDWFDSPGSGPGQGP